MLEFDGKYPAAHSKAKFQRFSVKNSKKSAVKQFIEKPILLNFVAALQRCSKENVFWKYAANLQETTHASVNLMFISYSQYFESF